MSASLNANSNSVILDNVDDYLAPSQACINPLFQPSAASDKNDGEQPSTITEDQSETTSGAVVVPRRRRRRKIQQPPSVVNDETPAIRTSLPEPAPNNNSNNKKDAVKASMADCLACSGCVTTAETVLLEQQHSLSSLRERLQKQSDGKLRGRIITISPNSWADLCRHWKLTDNHNDSDEDYFFYKRFTTLLSRILSAQVVVDGNVPLQWTWIDEAEEFCNVYQKNNSINGTTKRATPFPSVAIDSNKTQILCPDGNTKILDTSQKHTDSDEGTPSTPTLPLISGSCPALVCLVEKTLTHLVPHLSQTVSPMSMVGMVLKEKQPQQHGKYIHWDHWAIMPCHDKKLEASRKDFYITKDNRNERCVDLVISTKECVELVEEWIVTQTKRENGSEDTSNVAKYLQSLPPSDLSTSVLQPSDLAPNIASYALSNENSRLIAAPTLHRVEGNDTGDTIVRKQMAFASGGHANFILQYAANKLFGCNPEDLNVEWTAASLAAKDVKSARLARQRKQHFYEAKLYRKSDGAYSCNYVNDAEATVVLHFATAHGMQTMQRALKAIANDSQGIHYLEAMACPHGCVNGGGSARSQSTSGSSNGTVMIRETPTETQTRVQKTLGELQVPNPTPESSTAKHIPIRTRYHVVPPMQYTMGATAGVQVDKIQW